MGRIVWLTLALALSGLAETPETRLRALVEELCADELEGRVRGTDGGRQAAERIARAFEQAGLEPWGEGWLHGFETAHAAGLNVLGWLPGRSERVIVVGAHFDGDGYVDGFLVPGADHNASAIAVMTELARALADAPREHGVLFAAFDFGLGAREGSHTCLSALGAERVVAMINLEMVGGDPVPGLADSFFALGGESSPALAAAIEATATGLDVLAGGIYLVEGQGPRGDYEAFRAAEVPFLFVSTGVTPHYNRPSDGPEHLNYAKMAALAEYLRGVVAHLAAAPEAPFRGEESPPTQVEVRGVLHMLENVLADRERLALSEATVEALEKRAEKIGRLAGDEEIPMRKRRYLQKTLEMILVIITQAEAAAR